MASSKLLWISRRAYYASVSHVDDEIGRYSENYIQMLIQVERHQGVERVGRAWLVGIDNSCLLGRPWVAAGRTRGVVQTH